VEKLRIRAERAKRTSGSFVVFPYGRVGATMVHLVLSCRDHADTKELNACAFGGR
jgi:hypothetical protein